MKLLRQCRIVAALTLAVPVAGCGYGELVRLYFQEKEYQNDQELIAKIKGALLADPQVRASPVLVAAYLGDIRLSGTVSSAALKQQAEKVSEEVSGVESVDNDLVVRKP
jgi:hyperosmotically inducible protein